LREPPTLAILPATVLATLAALVLATLPALLAAASWLLLLLTGLLSAALLARLAGLRIVWRLLVRILVRHHRLLRHSLMWRGFPTLMTTTPKREGRFSQTAQ
jgi:hypothetical protein